MALDFVSLDSGEFSQATRDFEQHAEKFANAVDRLAAILGMQAENDQRKLLGESMAYGYGDFVHYQR